VTAALGNRVGMEKSVSVLEFADYIYIYIYIDYIYIYVYISPQHDSILL
jgi:hypothetical protein